MERLIEAAKKASENSYSPYSMFPVGASLITKDNKIYQGCYVENASFGLTNCAERTCLFTAYTDGIRKDDILAMCIYSPKHHIVSPCGACRQVMVELLNVDCKVILVCGSGERIDTTVKELLPLMFTNGDLNND